MAESLTCNSVQFIADLKSGFKPGSQRHFDQQMILCEADKLPFNRKLRSATQAVGILTSNPSIVNTDQAEKYHDACEAAYKVLCRGLDVALYLAGNDDNLKAQVEAKQIVAKDEFDKLEDLWLRADKVVPEPDGGGRAGPSTEAARLIDTSLRQEKLTMDVQPGDYRKWRGALESFFEANDLAAAKHKVQNSHVLSCINTEIRDLISAEIAEVPAFDDVAGIVQLIEKVYSRKHTATSKKLALFTCKTKQGEKPIAFVARLNQLFTEADLVSMSVDETKRFFLISGITHSGLRSKLLDVAEPTYAKLVAKIDAWTAASETARVIEHAQQEAAKVNAVKTNGSGRGGARGGAGRGRGGQRGGGNGRGGAGRGWIEPPSTIKNTPTSMQGRCSACGSKSHMKKDCSKAATATCSTCRGRGHFATVCMADYYAWRDKHLRPNNTDGARVAGITGEEQYSDSEYDEGGAAAGGHLKQD